MDESRYGASVIFVGGIQILLAAILSIGGLLYPPPESELLGVDSGLWYVLFWGLLLVRLGFLLRGDALQFTDRAEEFPRWGLTFEAYLIAFIAIIGAVGTLLVHFGYKRTHQPPIEFTVRYCTKDYCRTIAGELVGLARDDNDL